MLFRKAIEGDHALPVGAQNFGRVGIGFAEALDEPVALLLGLLPRRGVGHRAEQRSGFGLLLLRYAVEHVDDLVIPAPLLFKRMGPLLKPSDLGLRPTPRIQLRKEALQSTLRLSKAHSARYTHSQQSKEPRPSGRGFLEEGQLFSPSLLRLMKSNVLLDYIGCHFVTHRPNNIPIFPTLPPHSCFRTSRNSSRISFALTAFNSPTTALIEYFGKKLRNR